MVLTRNGRGVSLPGGANTAATAAQPEDNAAETEDNSPSFSDDASSFNPNPEDPEYFDAKLSERITHFKALANKPDDLNKTEASTNTDSNCSGGADRDGGNIDLRGDHGWDDAAMEADLHSADADVVENLESSFLSGAELLALSKVHALGLSDDAVKPSPDDKVADEL